MEVGGNEYDIVEKDFRVPQHNINKSYNSTARKVLTLVMCLNTLDFKDLLFLRELTKTS